MQAVAQAPNLYEKLAQKLKIKHLLQKVLILIGKPFYFLFYFIIIILFLAFSWLKKISQKLNLKIISTLLVLFSLYFLILRDLPTPTELTTRQIEVSTKIYDRNGVLLYKIYKDQNRTIVPLEKIPLHVRLATLAIEDAEFYSHPGFSVRGISRAIIRNIKKGELSGGSTITQQLVKNALLSSEKTLVRKIREIILAIGVELTFSKDEILEMYLNEVSYGGTAYGIQEASQLYFGKDVNQLSLSEAALLAGLPKSPTKYSPFGPNPDLALARQKQVLKLMVINNYITQEQAKKAAEKKLIFAPNRIDIKAPHFVMYVKQALVEKYGEELIEKGGLEVITTLDYRIQKMAEEVVKTEIEKLKKLNVTNGAVLVIQPQTGEILAMVGSSNYFDTKNSGNVNVTTRLRPPGSAIKPINYAYALSHGYTPATILSDTPVTFSIQGQPPYSPRNYDQTFRGRITLRSALAESRNVPAVKVLASYGVDKMIEMGQKMGITNWNDKSRFGLSLTLGGGSVKLIDLARVYATIANYGKQPQLSSIIKITNYKGKVLEKNVCCKEKSVLDKRIAYLLIDILRDNTARTPTFGSHSDLVIPSHPEVAVKTGTSNDFRDNLAIGFSQKYLVAVWVGNNDNSPMAKVISGVTGASPIWNKIMSTLLAKEESQEWPIPTGLVQRPICILTGTLPCKGCPTRIEWFLEENQPKYACNPQTIKSGSVIKKKRNSGQILDSAAKNIND